MEAEIWETWPGCAYMLQSRWKNVKFTKVQKAVGPEMPSSEWLAVSFSNALLLHNHAFAFATHLCPLRHCHCAVSSPSMHTARIPASEPFFTRILASTTAALSWFYPLNSFFFVPIQVSRGSKFHLTFSLAVGLLQTSIFSIKVASPKLTLFTERNQQYRRSRFTCTKNNSQREARLTQAVLKRCKVDHKLSKQLR